MNNILNTNPQFLVIGGGGIGMFSTYLLSKADNTALIMKVRSGYQEIKEHGFILEINDEEITHKPAVVDNLLLSTTTPRIVVIATKTYDLGQILNELKANQINCVGFFLPINGIPGSDCDLEESIADRYRGIPIVSGSITLPVEKISANYAKITNTKGGIALAPYKNTVETQEVLELLRKAFSKSDFQVMVCENYIGMRWSKMLLNMIGNAVCAILNYSANKLFADRRGAAIERGCLREFFQIMDYLGIKLINLPGWKVQKLRLIRLFCSWWMPLWIFQQVMLKTVANARGDKLPSIHDDLERAKRTITEILNYNGGIVFAAQQKGIKTPFNSTTVKILQSISKRYFDNTNAYRHENGIGLLWHMIRQARKNGE